LHQKRRTPLSPDFINAVTLRNDVTGREIKILCLGPDPDTCEIPARKAKKIYNFLMADASISDASYLGSHGTQEWNSVTLTSQHPDGGCDVILKRKKETPTHEHDTPQE
jgi:hypothetical protein